LFIIMGSWCMQVEIHLIPVQLGRTLALTLAICIRFFSPTHETITFLSSAAGFVSGLLAVFTDETTIPVSVW
jgi:hypothetical protein